MDQVLLDKILHAIGLISASSFVIVMTGDFLVATLQKVAEKTVSQRDDKFSQGVAKWWEILKSVWEDTRAFADRLSLFSRPKDQNK